MFKDNSAQSFRKTRYELIKTTYFFDFLANWNVKKKKKSFFSNTECPLFPPKIKLCFFCKIGLVSNRLWKKSFMWPYLNELLDSENGIKNKKFYMGANFQRFNLWMAISWEWQLVRSSNFSGFLFHRTWTWYDSGILDSFPPPFLGLNKYQRSDFTNCRSLSKIKF